MSMRVSTFKLLAIGLLLMSVNALSMELPPNVKQAIAQATIAEDDMITGPPGCTDTVFNYMKQNWRSVLDNLNEIAPTDNQKMIIMRAGGALDAQDYLNYLEKIRELRISGKIDSKTFDDALANENDLKGGFLDVNYQNPQVRKFVESLHGLVPSKDIDELLSGKGKAEFEEVLAADGHQIDPSLLLPSSASIASRASESATTPSPTETVQPSPSSVSPSPSATVTQLPQSTSSVFYAIAALVAVIAIVFIVIWMKKAP